MVRVVARNQLGIIWAGTCRKPEVAGISLAADSCGIRCACTDAPASALENTDNGYASKSVLLIRLLIARGGTRAFFQGVEFVDGEVVEFLE